MLLKLTPILLAIGYGLLMLRFSVWQTKRMLDSRSKPLVDAEISALAGIVKPIKHDLNQALAFCSQDAGAFRR